MNGRLPFLDRNWWSYQLRYLRHRTPWDTRITPPEVMEFLSRSRPGRALDLGCGTGTNAMTLTKHGWQVTGVDFVPQAILAARRRAARRCMSIDFRIGDVSDLGTIGGPFDYALDIGCFHTLPADKQRHYATELVKRLRPGAKFMLYAWLPRIWQGKRRGIAADTVRALFEPALRQERVVVGEERGGPSAWYWFVKSDEDVEGMPG